GIAGDVLVHRHQHRDAGAALVFRAHGVAGSLGRDHHHVEIGARLDQVEMDVEAVREHERRTLLHVVGEVLAIDVGLQLVGREHHHHVRPFGGGGDVHDLELFALRLLHALRALAQRDGHVLDAGVAQVEPVGVTLPAVADDGDLLAFDQVDVGVAIVINAHGFLTPARPGVGRCLAASRFYGPPGQAWRGRSASHPLRPAADRDDAGARDLDQAERDHQRDEAFDLVARAGDLEHEALGRGIDHAGAESIGEPQRLHAVIALAAHLDHGELALDVRPRHRHVDHAVHRHEPIELALDLLDHHGRAAGHDGDARKMLLVLGFGDGERFDVVAAPGEQADHPRQYAGLVVDQHRQGVGLDLLGDGRGGGGGGVRVRTPDSYGVAPAHSASSRVFTPVFDGLWTRVNALMLGTHNHRLWNMGPRLRGDDRGNAVQRQSTELRITPSPCLPR